MLSFLFQRPQHSGSTLRVTYSECYEDQPEFVPYVRKKGDRADTTKQLLGPQDSYVFSGEAGAPAALDLAYTKDAASIETFSPFHFRTLRFLSLDIDVSDKSELVMEGLTMNETHYPLEVIGSFDLSSDSPTNVYENMWKTSVQTLLNCMHDCYEDCPFYEQLQYAMDARSSCLFTYVISGDDRMARQTITQLHNSYRPKLGLIASRSPAHQLQIIPHFSLFWVCTVTDHFDHFADEAFTRQFLSTCDGILESFARRIDAALGLVASRKEDILTTWDFVDWANEWRPMGIPPAAERTGFQTFTNLIYAYTLQNLARVVTHLGRPTLGEEYLSRAHSVISAVREHSWDGTNFSDGLVKTAIQEQDLSQHNQVWGVLCGAVKGDEARTLLRRTLLVAQPQDHLPESGAATSDVSQTPKFTKASTAMSLYALRAMSEAGGSVYDDAFHGFWEPWRHQLSQNLTTWCEDDVTTRSDCHAWSSVPIYEFMVEIAGISPATPGWKGVAFKPRVNLFPEFKASVPLGGVLAGGVAKVSWTRDAAGASVGVKLQLEKVPNKEVVIHVTFPDGHTEEHVGQTISVQF